MRRFRLWRAPDALPGDFVGSFGGHVQPRPHRVRAHLATAFGRLQGRSPHRRMWTLGEAPALPVSRSRCDRFAALATLKPNVAATARAEPPDKTDAEIRSRKSSAQTEGSAHPVAQRHGLGLNVERILRPNGWALGLTARIVPAARALRFEQPMPAYRKSSSPGCGPNSAACRNACDRRGRNARPR